LLPENYFKESFGKRNETIISDILKWSEDKEEIHRIARAKEEIFRSIILKRGLSPLPGVSDFLTMLRREMVPCAVGSSTPYLNISTALEILDFHDCFQAIVAAEDVTVGKPDPQVFLLAAQKLNVPPGCCVVFEDALAGIAAARAGGMKVVAVATANRASELIEADLVVQRLDELSIDSLKKLFL
jgi:HAD superfamily hydrolase (TIGR01509 family)